MSTALDRIASKPSLLPVPVVVDACVLLRNVGYTLRKERTGALLSSASPEYTLFSGVVLFVTEHGLDEVERNLPKIAHNARVPAEDAFEVWDGVFLPRIRVIDFNEELVNDPRVEAVRALHANDAPTAALAVALAPCLLLTDNRSHFAPLGLPDRPVDDISLDIHQVSGFVTGANSAMLVTGLTGVGVYEGTKKLVATMGRDGALLLALLLAGAAYLYWKSEPGGRFRKGVATVTQKAGPPLLEAIEQGLEASDRISALAIEPGDEQPSAFRYVAQRLAVGQTTMSTAEIAQCLNEAGYTFEQDGNYRTLTRAWLVKSLCFFEVRRGHWSLGYYALPRGSEVA